MRYDYGALTLMRSVNVDSSQRQRHIHGNLPKYTTLASQPPAGPFIPVPSKPTNIADYLNSTAPSQAPPHSMFSSPHVGAGSGFEGGVERQKSRAQGRKSLEVGSRQRRQGEGRGVDEVGKKRGEDVAELVGKREGNLPFLKEHIKKN